MYFFLKTGILKEKTGNFSHWPNILEETHMTQEKINRLNELARRSRTVPLSPEEKAEQQVLRQEYLAAIRRNLRATLESIEVVDGPDHSE